MNEVDKKKRSGLCFVEISIHHRAVVSIAGLSAIDVSIRQKVS